LWENPFTRFYDMDDTLNPLMIGMQKKEFLENKELVKELIYQTKEDGSIILLFYYRSNWHLATRSTFADGTIGKDKGTFTWYEYFLKGLSETPPSMTSSTPQSSSSSVDSFSSVSFSSVSSSPSLSSSSSTTMSKKERNKAKLQDWANSALDPHYSYIFELCGPYNKVVCEYSSPCLYLLAAFVVDEKVKEVELSDDKLNLLASKLKIRRPETHIGVSLDKLDIWFQQLIKKHGLFEGFVIKRPEKGKEALRFKAKTSEYILYHRNLGKQTSDEDLVKILLLQDNQLLWDRDDTADYERIKGIQEKLIIFQKEVNEKWNQLKEIKDAKSFAKEVVDCDFKALLFMTRKANEKTEINQIPREIWLQSIHLILGRILGRQVKKVKEQVKKVKETEKKKKNPS